MRRISLQWAETLPPTGRTAAAWLTRAVAAVLVMCLISPLAVSGSDLGPLEAFLVDAEDADVVVIGEIHDNPQHHEIQARVVQVLQPDAIVFEMIPEAQSATVNDLRAEGTGRDAIKAALDWDNSGWPSFDFYAPILEAAPDARIYGAGQSRETIRQASREGAAATLGPEAARYGLTSALPAQDVASRREEMAIAHCGALPDDALDGMIEVQRLWDATLARAALSALEDADEGAQVVMIAGNGHADRVRGAPKVIAQAEPDLEIRVLGLLEGTGSADLAFDMTISTAAPERGDPCEIFETRKTD